MALTEYFIRYLSRRDTLSAADLRHLRDIPTTLCRFAPGEVIVGPGASERSCLVLRGMAARVHAPPGRDPQRVVTALHVPGDFPDLHGFVLAGLDHAVVSAGPSEIEFVEHVHLVEVTRHFPHLTRLLWMTTAIDAAISRQWLVASNTLRSSAHLAHLLCEIYTRLASVGAASDYRLTLPLLQRELADILGYSSIHVNRAVRELRDRGLVRWAGTEIDILDWPGLVRLARFDPSYLDLECQPR